MATRTPAENTPFGNTEIPFHTPTTGVDSSNVVVVSSIPLNVDPISIGLPTELSMIGSRLKEEIDMDMVTKELTGRFRIVWLGEGKLASSVFTLKVTEDPMWVYEKALSRFGVHAQGVGKKLVKANGLGGNWKVAALLIGTSLAPRYSKQTANLQMIDVRIPRHNLYYRHDN
ncbi:hypothetical protein M9H77_23742 [Catharanthus roseus]|uniref:Uncharacterized protein n=1 Tax=Catharanthus roseus TaxID=4058 RepID=A0ACC0AU44_CATRO|nr:hypothetical protein M9H77_23742 [Catharanthus roseus]